MMNFSLIGPPGSGKDTQVEIIKNKLGYVSISGGDISRELAKGNGEIAKIVAEGGLIDDRLIMQELDKELEKLAPTQGIILNGIPRTMYQAEQISQILVRHNRVLDGIAYIEVSEEEVVKRLTKRKICSACGRLIEGHLESCKYCGALAESREDDTPAVIINRMQIFLDNTIPLITYFRNKDMLITINGEQTPEKVTEEIMERLDLCQRIN